MPILADGHAFATGALFFMEEIWKDVVGFEGFYKVSNDGKIKSLCRNIPFTNRWGQRITKKSGEIIMKPKKISTCGYIRIQLMKNATAKIYSLHRIVALAFLENPENLPQVNHKDGNKLNNNDWNLEWCTNSHNQLHAYKFGLNRNASGFEDSQSKHILHIFNGNEMKYGSIKIAAKATGIHAASISRCASNTNIISVGKNKGHSFIFL